MLFSGCCTQYWADVVCASAHWANKEHHVIDLSVYTISFPLSLPLSQSLPSVYPANKDKDFMNYIFLSKLLLHNTPSLSKGFWYVKSNHLLVTFSLPELHFSISKLYISFVHVFKFKLAKLYPQVNPICDRCKPTEKSLIHMFWFCSNLEEVWNSVFQSLWCPYLEMFQKEHSYSMYMSDIEPSCSTYIFSAGKSWFWIYVLMPQTASARFGQWDVSLTGIISLSFLFCAITLKIESTCCLKIKLYCWVFNSGTIKHYK